MNYFKTGIYLVLLYIWMGKKIFNLNTIHVCCPSPSADKHGFNLFNFQKYFFIVFNLIFNISHIYLAQRVCH